MATWTWPKYTIFAPFSPASTEFRKILHKHRHSAETVKFCGSAQNFTFHRKLRFLQTMLMMMMMMMIFFVCWPGCVIAVLYAVVWFLFTFCSPLSSACIPVSSRHQHRVCQVHLGVIISLLFLFSLLFDVGLDDVMIRALHWHLRGAMILLLATSKCHSGQVNLLPPPVNII